MAIDVTKIKDETVRRALYEVGSGLVALSSPSLGAATATSINKVALTAPATSATLTIADGKTATISKTMTLTSADDTTVATLPAGAHTLAQVDSPSLTDPITNMCKVSTGALTKNADTTFAIIPGLSVPLAAGKTY